MTAETKATLRQIACFYALCLFVGGLLSLFDFRGGRIPLELGTGGYIDNLKFGGIFLALIFILLEYAVLRWQRRADSYDWKDSGSSFWAR